MYWRYDGENVIKHRRFVAAAYTEKAQDLALTHRSDLWFVAPSFLADPHLFMVDSTTRGKSATEDLRNNPAYASDDDGKEDSATAHCPLPTATPASDLLSMR